MNYRILFILLSFLPILSSCDGIAKFENTTTPPCQMKHYIQQYGIRWTFDKEYECGQFVNGDYYVIGPAMIISVSPEQSPGRNGSMINPAVGPQQAYDDRIRNYNEDLNISFPRILQPGESLVSTISLESSTAEDVMNYTISSNHARLKTAAVLTCLDSPPPEGSFRPPYVGISKTIYTSSQIRYDLLPNIETVEISPNKYGYNSYEETAKAVFSKVWLNHKTDWSCRQMHPVDNMPNYHREIATVWGDFLLYILTDTTEKEELLIPFLQVGIDTYHMCVLGEGNSAFLKWPVLFTGIMLDEPSIYNVFNEGRCKYPDGTRGDRMTYYIEDGESTFISGDYGGQNIDSGSIWTGYVTETGRVPAWRQDAGGHEHEHLHPSEWADGNPIPDGGGFKREVYRRINSRTYVAHMLAALIMGKKALWNHDAFFDYVDRWMDEDMSEECNIMNSYSPPWQANPEDYQTATDFAVAMWNKYRDSY